MLANSKKKNKVSIRMDAPPELPKMEEEPKRDGTIVEMAENSDDDDDGLA
jgi:hypothetical protein